MKTREILNNNNNNNNKSLWTLCRISDDKTFFDKDKGRPKTCHFMH